MDDRLTLQKLELFCLVARLGSVTRAAEELILSQPAVSSHLRSVEEAVGVKLFRRQGRGLVLTAAGERVLEWASEVLTRGQELSRELEGFRDGEIGTCVVAASMTAGSYALPRVVAKFHAARPRALVRVNISNPDGAMDAARAGECDLAVVIVDPRHRTDGLELEHLCDEELVLVTTPERAAQLPTPMRPGDLRDLPFVTSPRGVVRRDTEDVQLRRLGVERMVINAELGHPEAMKRAVLGGLGAAFLLRSSVEDELHAGILAPVSVAHLSLTVPCYLVHRLAKQLSPLQEAFAESVRDHFRAL